MVISFGREICGHLDTAESREWLVTNGIGGYASGTIAGLLTRRYHGLLVAALKPPLERTLLLTKLDETASYNGGFYPLYCNRWANSAVEPHGYRHIEQFYLKGTTPVWQFACADALLEKQIWMQPGANTTYIRYHLHRATKPLTLTIKALVNYRGYHQNTHAGDWQMSAEAVEHGVCVKAYSEAAPLYLLMPDAVNNETFRISTPPSNWYYGFDLAIERYRGLNDYEDHLHAVTFHATIQPGQSITVIATTESSPELNSQVSWEGCRKNEQQLLETWLKAKGLESQLPEQNLPEQNLLEQKQLTINTTPTWLHQLVLAADQFIVSRPLPEETDGKTIIAGYHWFADWGRDTMISLPGLTLTTGRPDVARSILRTFSRYVDQGMLPNRFPDAGDTPDYNTVDAALWYFEAIRAYHEATDDDHLLSDLFPVLADIIDWYRRGTRYNIHLDSEDGLIYAGESGWQLTWMDAKVGNWVVTPRQGKPIEVSALWYNALQAMVKFAQHLGKPHQEYEQLAAKTAQGFTRFWYEEGGYCYDVIDTPYSNDGSIRPNQIFAVSLPPRGRYEYQSLLTVPQQRRVVDICAQNLLTSSGLRTLSPDHPQYQGKYGGDQLQRDGAYHQGTVWGWLIGAFALAHFRVYHNAAQALEFLAPMANQILAYGIGSLGEICDGDPPMQPRGCIAQAWTVGEVLRAWSMIQGIGNRE